MSWETIRLEGGLLTTDHLERIRSKDSQMPGIRPTDYDVAGNLDSKLSEAWRELRNAWGGQFAVRRATAKDDDDAYRATVDSWLKYVFASLGFAGFKPAAGPAGGDPRPVTWGDAVPFHVVAFNKSLEKGADGTARRNPHSVIQQHLNDGKAKWGIVTNGLSWRILRDNATHTRPAYIEFDLNAMMEGDRFDEFRFFWLISHATRFTGDNPIIEQWMRESARLGVKARDALRDSVEGAIRALGEGFLQNSNNVELRRRLELGTLTQQEYFHQVLRLVYRLLFLFVTEERNLLLASKPGQSKDDFAVAARIYRDFYSMRRLRDLATSVQGSRHEDMYEGLKVVMNGLKEAKGCPQLALPPLNSDLWSPKFIPDLDAAKLRNADFLSAIHRLNTIKDIKGKDRRVNYGNLDAEELGSVYEALLDLKAELDLRKSRFELLNLQGQGSERRSTGSHYTPTDLVELVLDHALNPALEEASKKPDPARALLELTVCDPTCGSGHFLIAAAHRIARRLAYVRTGEEEPAPDDLRHALRDVIGQCLYGVDINPMSVELCKVSLWLEAMEPGKPLAYLESRIKCGNALLGAFPEYLQRGIPPQAFIGRDGVDNPVAIKLLRKSNDSLDMSSTTLTAYRDDIKKVEMELASALEHIDAMPTNSVREVEQKDAEYRQRFLETRAYQRHRLALDAWCAAFSYAKKNASDEANITTGQILDLLNTQIEEINPALYELIVVERKKPENNFFPWHIEFPNVFQAGGFDVVLGNPPYLGGQKVSGTLGHHYNHFLEAIHPEYQSKSDLAGAFLRLFWRLRKSTGKVGIITTNMISKGETRESSLAPLVRGGAFICMAYPEILWQGQASVVVTVLVLGNPSERPILQGVPVSYISSRLDTAPEAEISVLESRAEQCFMGDIPVGDGFLLTPDEAENWLSREEKLRDVVFPYLTASDLLQDPGHDATRWIICFHDWTEDKARAYKLAFEKVEREVKPVRATTNRAAHRERWWRFGEYRTGLRRATASLSNVIVKAGVSETPVFIRVANRYVFSNRLFVFALEDWESCGVLNSEIHEVWYRKTGGSLKQDSAYTPSTCFETFPVPNRSDFVASRGREFHEYLLEVARKRALALTPVWNLFNDPACMAADIVQLRESRCRLTEAVATAYGIPEQDFRFGFYKDKAGRNRFSMQQMAADEVVAHLMKLNTLQSSLPRTIPVGSKPLPGGQKGKPSQQRLLESR